MAQAQVAQVRDLLGSKLPATGAGTGDEDQVHAPQSRAPGLLGEVDLSPSTSEEPGL